MKKHLPGIVLSSITFCLLIISLSSVSGQTGASQPTQGKSAVSDSVAHSLAVRIKIYPIPVKSELIARNVGRPTKPHMGMFGKKRCALIE